MEEIELIELFERVRPEYAAVKNVAKAFIRDFNGLESLGAIRVEEISQNRWKLSPRLKWPSEMTESEFFEKIRQMPKGKTYRFLP